MHWLVQAMGDRHANLFEDWSVALFSHGWIFFIPLYLFCPSFLANDLCLVSRQPLYSSLRLLRAGADFVLVGSCAADIAFCGFSLMLRESPIKLLPCTGPEP